MKLSIRAVYLLVVAVHMCHGQYRQSFDGSPYRFGTSSNAGLHAPARSSFPPMTDRSMFQHFSEGSQGHHLPDRSFFQRFPGSPVPERLPFQRTPVPSDSEMADADLKTIETLQAEQEKINDKMMAARQTLSLLGREMGKKQRELSELQQERKRNMAELTYAERLHSRHHTFSGVRPIPEDATLYGPSDYRITTRDDRHKSDAEPSAEKDSPAEESDKVVVERPKFPKTKPEKAVAEEKISIKHGKRAKPEAIESTTVILQDSRTVLEPTEKSLVVDESKEILIEELNNPPTSESEA